MSESDRDRASGFVGRSVLPGESQEEFDRLRDELWEQYEPKGAIEEDLVETIATSIWRKRHINIFHRAFKARMKWGSYFGYAGDPDGASRISQKQIQLISALREQVTIKFAIIMVERKLSGDADPVAKVSDSAERGVASVAAEAPKQENFVGAIKANGITGGDDIPEGILKTIVDTALDEIKTAFSRRAGQRAISSKVKGIVEKIVKRELAADNEKAQNDTPRTIDGQIEKMCGAFVNMMSVLEPVLGPGVVEKILEMAAKDITEQALAEFGDLLTPECFVEEFGFTELLEARIERALNRLTKVQAQRIKKAAANIVSLQPGWATRRR